MLSEDHEKFHDKTWFTILLLIVFMPIGIIFMWKKGKFHPLIRVLITAAFVLYIWGQVSPPQYPPTESTQGESHYDLTLPPLDSDPVPDTASPQQNSSPKPKESPVQILSHNRQFSSMGPVIAGQAKNITSEMLSLVIIYFNLYNSSGAQIGTAIASTTNLEPGVVWQFTSSPSTGDWDSYKIIDVEYRKP